MILRRRHISSAMFYRAPVQWTAIFLLAAGASVANAIETDCVPVLAPDVWMSKTGGLWTQGDRYGHYRVVVVRSGVEHSIDRVQLEILRVKDETRTIVHCIALPSPGLKGHVIDLRIHSISESAAVVTLDIEMKAMEGIVLRDAFIVAPTGQVLEVSIA